MHSMNEKKNLETIFFCPVIQEDKIIYIKITLQLHFVPFKLLFHKVTIIPIKKHSIKSKLCFRIKITKFRK